jgi:hypothetical protein
MSRYREWLGTIVVSSAMLLAACSSSSSSSTTAAGTNVPAATSAPSSVTQGVNPGGDFCTLLKAEKAKAAKLSSTIGAAVATNDFATTKKNLTDYFNALGQDLAQIEASMTDAPADVQAAVQTVNQYFTQLQTALANASSLQDLETSFNASTTDTSAIKAAGKTLKAYVTAQCGTQSP